MDGKAVNSHVPVPLLHASFHYSQVGVSSASTGGVNRLGVRRSEDFEIIQAIIALLVLSATQAPVILRDPVERVSENSSSEASRTLGLR